MALSKVLLRLKCLAFSLIVLGCLLSSPGLAGRFNLAALAATTNNGAKGLSISPATDFEIVNAGVAKTASLTVADSTPNPLEVSLSVKQFTVNNYSYTDNFNSPANNWVSITSSPFTLLPGQHLSLPYTITVPAGSPPGGQYYTLVASATLNSGSLKTTLQAASILYLTVNGHLTYTSRLINDSIQRFNFGSTINYHFDVINTGNTFFFIYISGKLSGPTASPAQTAVAHLVIPGKIRKFSGGINHPTLPGIYKATYGYTTDTGTGLTQSRLIVYLPLWFIALVLVILLGLNLWYTRHSRRSQRSNRP